MATIKAFYLVVDDLGRFGRVWREADYIGQGG
jgi:hypothetical protein